MDAPTTHSYFPAAIHIVPLEDGAEVKARTEMLRVEGEGSPALGLAPHRVALEVEEEAELEVRVDVLRVEGDGRPALGLGPCSSSRIMVPNLERGFYTTQTASFEEPAVKSKFALRSVVYGAHTDGS